MTSSSSAPTVSIVIPAYNEESTIRACVTAALAQTVPAHEVIVVDNRSTDRTAAIVAELQAANPDAPLRVIPQFDDQGLVPTRNLGLDSATGDVIGRIDADSVLEPTWVEEVAKAFQDPEVAAATGPVLYYDMPLRRFGLRADDTLQRAMLRLAREYHFVFGSNMALRATAWQAIRDEVCRDEEDLFHEDIDISVHLYDAGLGVSRGLPDRQGHPLGAERAGRPAVGLLGRQPGVAARLLGRAERGGAVRGGAAVLSAGARPWASTRRPAPRPACAAACRASTGSR